MARSFARASVYYGNGLAVDQQNRTGVWDANFKGVWHLGNGTAADSTGNANNGIVTGASPTTGKMGGGASFNRTNSDNIRIPGSDGESGQGHARSVGERY